MLLKLLVILAVCKFAISLENDTIRLERSRSIIQRVKFYVPSTDCKELKRFYISGSKARNMCPELVVGQSIRIFVHGYIPRPPMLSGEWDDICKAYKETSPPNIILMDWTDFTAVGYYLIPRNKVIGHFPEVSKKLVMLIKYLVKHKFVESVNNIHLIGFSFGAHVAGLASRQYKVGRVSGLDPARLNRRRDDWKLRKSDGVFVDAVHTGGSSGIVGHVDFFSNGGHYEKQPGCENKTEDGTRHCGHGFSVKLWSRTVKHEEFYGCECIGVVGIGKQVIQHCNKPSICMNKVLFGEYIRKDTKGMFYLDVPN